MSLHARNTAFFENMLQRWQAVGNTVSDLTGPRFEPQTSRSRDEDVTARPTGHHKVFIRYRYVIYQRGNFVIGAYLNNFYLC